MLTRGTTLVLTWRVALAALAVPLPGWAASDVVAVRLIDEPRELLEPSAVAEAVEVARWPLRSRADLEGWTTDDLIAVESDGGLKLRVTGPHPRLERSVTLDAGAVDGFHFEWAARHNADIELLWKRSGDSDWANANSARSFIRRVSRQRRLRTAGRARVAPATRDGVRLDPETAERAPSSGTTLRLPRYRSGRVACPGCGFASPFTWQMCTARAMRIAGHQTSLAAIVAVRYRAAPTSTVMTRPSPCQSALWLKSANQPTSATPRFSPSTRRMVGCGACSIG